jgi:hypothetical protein
MGKLKLWTGSMYPSGVRISLAEVLKIPESKVQVLQPYVGGAFGGRIDMQPLHPISALLSMKTGKPVFEEGERTNNEGKKVKTLSRLRLLTVAWMDVDAICLKLQIFLALWAPAFVLLDHVLGRLQKLSLIEDFLTGRANYLLWQTAHRSK